MLRTMELILGLEPDEPADHGGQPHDECFTETPDLTPYTALPNNIPLDQMNQKVATLKGKGRYYAKEIAQRSRSTKWTKPTKGSSTESCGMP